MEIGCKLKRARNDTGLTQEQAAELLAVSRQTISNWENNKSYPDIISVIRMSDIYSVSLDHLLKEESAVKQTYQDFLEESTNTVRAKRSQSKIILLSAYFLVWSAAMLVFWFVRGQETAVLDVVFRWILLPLLLFAATATVAKCDFWGRANWLCVPAAALTFLTIPYTQWVQQADTAMFTFRFPNLPYMAVGAAIALCGLAAGMLWRRQAAKRTSSRKNQ